MNSNINDKEFEKEFYKLLKKDILNSTLNKIKNFKRLDYLLLFLIK